MVFCKSRLRKFIFGFNGAEFTHDALITYQAMTCGFNIHHFCIRNKPLVRLQSNHDEQSDLLIFPWLCIIIPKYEN